jgi:hypothetical protein
VFDALVSDSICMRKLWDMRSLRVLV